MRDSRLLCGSSNRHVDRWAIGVVARDVQHCEERPGAGRREDYLNLPGVARREHERSRTGRREWSARRSADAAIELALAKVLDFDDCACLTVDVGGQPHRRMLHADL